MTIKRILWYEGAAYHITTRGNRKEAIFRAEEDFISYLKILKESIKYYSFSNYQLVAYCLMTNHVHLIIKTGEENMTNLMRRVNGAYTKYFNKKYNYSGHLFQGKYHYELIKDSSQMLQVSRYLHLNPVKAKMVSKPENYYWSSYKMFIGEKSDLVTTNNEIVLSFFYNRNNRISDRYRLYREFVEDGIRLLKLAEGNSGLLEN